MDGNLSWWLWFWLSGAVAAGRVLAVSLVARVAFNPRFPWYVRGFVMLIAWVSFLPVAIGFPR